MILTTWNVRGLNDPLKQKEVKNFLNKSHISYIALFETRVRRTNVAKIRKRFGIDWQWEDNNDFSPRGRIWFGWRPGEVKVQVLSKSEQVIVMEVENLIGSVKFHIAAVYGLHTVQDRKELWRELLNQTVECHDPLIIGDYNDVTHTRDRLNGAQITNHETHDFNDFIMRGQVMEAPSNGLFYSWTNNSIGDERVLSRIDKAFVNEEWICRYPDVQVQYLPSGISDHSPLMLYFGSSGREGGRPFKFHNILAEHEFFLDVVKEAWQSISGIYYLQTTWNRLKAVKEAMKGLHNRAYSNARQKVDDYRQRLKCIQAQSDLQQNVQLQLEERELYNQYRHWSKVDDSIMKQKSRIDWMTHRDTNSKLFFTATKVRKARNNISILYNDQGVLLTKPEEIQEEIVGFYRSLLGTAAPIIQAIDLQTVRAGASLSLEARSRLLVPITKQEINDALNNINDSKAPGIDGFNSFFYKKSWNIIKDDIYRAVTEFFEKERLHKPINATIITLIPKTENATKAKDFRPIACCTVLYKIISKIITKRLQEVIGEVVDTSQSGFKPNRHISENILLATELIRGYNRRSVSPRCCLKVDILKRPMTQLNGPFYIACWLNWGSLVLL